MASVQQDPSGNFHVTFRFGGKRFKRSLKTRHRRKADAAASHIEENIRLIQEGRMSLPSEADVPTFLLSDGKLATTPQLSPTIKLGELFSKYLSSIPADSLEETTITTAGVHMRHVVRLLGKSRPLNSIRKTDIQEYVTARSHEPGRTGGVSTTTIRKELSTFGSLWNWARSEEFVECNFPRGGVVFPKRDERPLFQTRAQITRQIEKNALSAGAAAALWECLYLSQTEITEVLAIVDSEAYYQFLHPMCMMAAYTGARRSELCRARVTDVDLDEAVFTIHERKRARHTRTTRTVPIPKVLRRTLSNWLQQKSLGPFLFPEDHKVQRPRKERAEEGCVTPFEASTHLKTVLSGTAWEVLSGFHSFRHSFISNCASKGVDQRFIDAWVGHQTDEQRRRYRHLFPDSQQEAIESVFG